MLRNFIFKQGKINKNLIFILNSNDEIYIYILEKHSNYFEKLIMQNTTER